MVDRDASPLSADDRERLAKLCGRLGSSFDGERAAAALKASEFIRSRGLTWGEVVNPLPTVVRAEPPPEPERRRAKPRRWGESLTPQAAAEQLLEYPELLTPKERAFCASISRWRGQPTDKQIRWLARIVIRVSAIVEAGYAG